MRQEVTEYKLREWSRIIAAANASEMKRKDWLELNGITKDTFYYWQKKLQAWILENGPIDASLELPSREDISPLVEVPIIPCSVNTPVTVSEVGAVINLGKLRIELNNNASAQLLESIGRMIHNAL